MFALTAKIKASRASPSKNCTSTSPSPRSAAARNRCIPSITRIVARFTMIGGSVASDSASARTCSILSPDSLGESDENSEQIGTLATASCSRWSLCDDAVAGAASLSESSVEEVSTELVIATSRLNITLSSQLTTSSRSPAVINQLLSAPGEITYGTGDGAIPAPSTTAALPHRETAIPSPPATHGHVHRHSEPNGGRGDDELATRPQRRHSACLQQSLRVKMRLQC